MHRLNIILKYGREFILLYLFFGLVSMISQIKNFQVVNLQGFIKEYFYQLYNYTINLIHGDFGTYSIGPRLREINEDIGLYALNSFSLLLISLLIGMTLSIIFGVYFVFKKKKGIGNIFFMILSSIPDFILVLLLQISIIILNKFIGFDLINIASYGEKQALLLPILSMSIIPMVFLINGVIKDASIILTEEYIRTAVAKGLTKLTVIRHHVLGNLLIILKTDLVKMLSIAIGNLFIVEYLYNIRGITRFLLNWNQYSVWMSGFLILAIFYVVIYFFLSFTLSFFRRLLTGE